MQQVDSAIAAGTWPSQPAPHLFAWGRNNTGQLGLGNTTYYSSPKQVGSLTTWSVIKAFTNQTNAIKTDGTLWAWGWNNFGQLGLGNLTYYSSPKQVGALTNWSNLANGLYYSMAIKTDGTLWAWGYGANGQLGLGNQLSYSSPKQVGSLTNWSSISAGYAFCVAVKTDGTLWSWGQPNYGQLGLGNISNYSSPKQIGALTSWLKVSCQSYANTFAIKSDGTLWSWGFGGQGQLGTGSTTSVSSPVQIGALTTWSSLSGGAYNCGAIKTDGTLWMWGQNNNGQLGIGNQTGYSSPKQIGGLTTWLTIVNGYSTFTAAISTSGALWTWGLNNAGQLGLGNTTSYSSPKQVGALTSWTNASIGANNMIAIAST